MTDTEIKDVLDEAVRRIVECFQPDRIILFGSFVNGTPTEDSDLDIMIVMPVAGSRRQKANEIDMALAERTVPMDLVVVTPEQFEREKNMIGTIVREAARKGRVLYERVA
jgi:predicted nucleotidyltransferase